MEKITFNISFVFTCLVCDLRIGQVRFYSLEFHIKNKVTSQNKFCNKNKKRIQQYSDML